MGSSPIGIIVLVAELVKASVCGTEDCGFESRQVPWEVGRVVYCTCFENRRSVKAPGGSNPSLPARMVHMGGK